MANLSRQQIIGILNNAPKGTTPEGIVSELRRQGHTLEGYEEAQPIEKEKTPGVLGSIARFTGMEKFGQGIGKFIFGFTKEKKELDTLLSQGKVSPKEYEDITTGGLTNKEVLGSALQTATTFVPGVSKGASLATKIGTGVATGYAYDVAGNLQQNKEGTDILKPGLGTILGGALPVLGKITGLDKGVAESSKNIATKLEKINERLTPVEKQNLEKQGAQISEYLAKKKIIGTPESRYAKINTLYNKMEDVVTKKVADSKKVFNKADVIKEITAIPEQFSEDPSGYKEAVSKVNALLKFIQEKAPSEIDATLLNKYKRNLFKRAYAKNNTDVVNETLHAAGEILKKKLDDNIPGLSSINNEYGKIITARKLLFKAQSRSQAGLFGKGAGLAAGASIGGAIAGPGGAAVGSFIGPQAAEGLATPLRSAVGAGFQTLSETLNKIPTDKKGNLQIGRKALLNIIQNIR